MAPLLSATDSPSSIQSVYFAQVVNAWASPRYPLRYPYQTFNLECVVLLSYWIIRFKHPSTKPPKQRQPNGSRKTGVKRVRRSTSPPPGHPHYTTLTENKNTASYQSNIASKTGPRTNQHSSRFRNLKILGFDDTTSQDFKHT